MAARSWKKKISATMLGTILYEGFSAVGYRRRIPLTSPAAEAKPERDLAANRPPYVGSFAVQIRTTKSINMEASRDARFPYLTPRGTHTRLPMPRNRKLS
jgi:hypothetical protein